MNNVIGFTVFNKVTGKEMATFPLTIPIGSTIEAYERDGHSVTWGWTKMSKTADGTFGSA
jgi:hypothetical protein